MWQRGQNLSCRTQQGGPCKNILVVIWPELAGDLQNCNDFDKAETGKRSICMNVKSLDIHIKITSMVLQLNHPKVTINSHVHIMVTGTIDRSQCMC
jgi:hypothetical protein